MQAYTSLYTTKGRSFALEDLGGKIENIQCQSLVLIETLEVLLVFSSKESFKQEAII